MFVPINNVFPSFSSKRSASQVQHEVMDEGVRLRERERANNLARKLWTGVEASNGKEKDCAQCFNSNQQ